MLFRDFFEGIVALDDEDHSWATDFPNVCRGSWD